MNEEARAFAERFDEGKWITIGAHKGKDGERHGGSRVFVKNGRIEKGHPSLTGKKPHDIKGDTAATTHRRELEQGKGYERAKYGKEAKEHGVNPKELHGLADQILEHDKAFKADRTRVLQDARELSRKLGYGDINALKANASRGMDADAVKGLDDVAERIAERYPEHFAGHGDPQHRLFDLLAAGNPQPMAPAEAYEQAMGHLIEQKQSQPEEWPSWQQGLYGGPGAKSVAHQRGMFPDQNKPLPPEERDRPDLPGQMRLPGTDVVPFAGYDSARHKSNRRNMAMSTCCRTCSRDELIHHLNFAEGGHVVHLEDLPTETLRQMAAKAKPIPKHERGSIVNRFAEGENATDRASKVRYLVQHCGISENTLKSAPDSLVDEFYAYATGDGSGSSSTSSTSDVSKSPCRIMQLTAWSR